MVLLSSLNVLLILFPGFNTLDMNGPYEVLRKSGLSQNFNVTVASETDITTSIEGLHARRDIALNHALFQQLPDYDMLVVPGGVAGPGSAVEAQAANITSPFMTLIKEFAGLAPSSTARPRVLLSICTGAMFLGTLGIFNDRYCTTHWKALTDLQKSVNDAAARTHGRPGTVVPARFVDSGNNTRGVRIISSGGVSAGLDASLYLVKSLYGEEEALDTAEMLDYVWRKTDGVVLDGMRYY
ncbi:ThiJ/PfpI family protein [Cercophora scortea]|uniref:ThiJ/PfpI family protein n=1 Tax=Cercophora scortea TaxID=314031 RepID=A0AAE0I2M2_9PEZI|nr:ThiJ/PfpI family protein [Cercophora scortea]